MSTTDPQKRGSDHLQPPEQAQKQVKVEDSELSTNPNLENNDSTDKPAEPQKCNISIQFHDEATFEGYKTEFLEFINSFREFCVKSEEKHCINVYKDEECSKERSTPRKHKKHSKAKKELFVVDTTPTQNSANQNLKYTTKFVIGTEAEAQRRGKMMKPTCFNCDEEEHSLRDCPYPKDYERINLARQKMKKQPTGRYHVEIEKFNHLHPGKLSKELRKALHLDHDEAPPYIYGMRKLGYPPGWLEEAKINESNLDLIGIDGKALKSKTRKKIGLDEKKVVEYAGFNVPFDEGIIDDYRHYGVPPYSENFSKQAMVEFFNVKCVEEGDLQDEETENNETRNEKNRTGRISPSLVDLEQQKKELLDELNAPKTLPKDEEQNVMPVKTSCFGTPLLKSASPYSKLPEYEKFSKDISPVINFENLPNSTGKYEQLVDVLQKVRTVIKSASVEEC